MKKTVKTNILFLKKLGDQTVTWRTGTLRPNLSRNVTIYKKFSEFTEYVLSKDDLEKVLSIVKEELLLVMPQEDLMGFIEGYDVYDLDCKLLLRFGEKNLPSGFTLKNIFTSVVRSQQNLEIYAELLREKKIDCVLQPTFEDYHYGYVLFTLRFSGVFLC